MLHIIPIQATNQPTLKYNILAIEYSEGCQKLLDYKLNSTCPTLNKIWKYDTSNHAISGKLVSSNGKFYRSNPELKNHYMWYESGKMIICVDCKLPLDRPDVFKTIFLEPSSFVYINNDVEIKNSLIWTSYSDRYVSPDCMTSSIAYSDHMLNDTISYILSGCTTTQINSTKTNYIKDTPFDLSNPYSSLHLQSYLKQIMHGNYFFTGNHTSGGLGPNNCITSHCQYKDPYSKPGWNKP